MQNPFFSIVIPTYNRAHTISRSLESVLKQDYSDWEVIIIDDASKDNTKEVVENFKEARFKYFRNENNSERSISRNRGIESSTGTYICFLDSDDYFLPDHLSSFYQSIHEQKDPVAFYFSDILTEKNNEIQKRVREDIKKYGHIVPYLLQNFLVPAQVCFHSAILKKHKFDENVNILVFEDFEFWLRVAAEFPVVPTNKYTAVEVYHEGNSTSRKNNVAINQLNGLDVVFSNRSISRHIPNALKNEAYGHRYYLKAMYHESVGENWEMMIALIKSIALHPSHPDFKGKLVMILYAIPGMKKLRNFIGILLLFLINFSCANKVAITGGVKDELPPKVEYSVPAAGTINFKSNEVVLHFDEYVKLNNFQSEFISSPPLKTFPDYRIKGKSIILKLSDKLIDSTTYILDFGNSIQDITEGNSLKNYQFAFSTGAYIDSLKIFGKILNAFDLKPEKNVAIMLYSNQNDTAPLTTLPNYYTKSNDDGSFSLTHIKEGTYQIFALVDANSNYMFDLATEKIAFIDTFVQAGEADTIELYLFEEKNAKLHLNKINADEYGKMMFVFNMPADSAHIIPLNTNLHAKWKIEEWSVTHDSLTYWIPDSVTDTLKLQLAIDTIVDTLQIAMSQKPVQAEVSKKGKRTKVFKLTNKSNVSAAFDLNKEIVIEFSHPIAACDFLKIMLLENADSVLPEISFSDSLHRYLHIKHQWKEEILYTLLIPDSAITDIFGLYNDSIQYVFKTKNIKQYGTATLHVVVPDSSQHTYILQLMNDKNVVLKENYIYISGKIEYSYLDAGNYKLKAIEDRNNNKKWDTGKYKEKLLPEKVSIYLAPLSVRSNWDMDIDWNLK